MAVELVFYTNPMSRGRIIRWMLEEVGQPYRTQVLAYEDRGAWDAYRAVNPMAKVPTIVHGGTVVTECAAICAYLADAFPEKRLAPPVAERADYYRWLFFAAGPLEQAITDRARKVEPNAEQSRMVGYGDFDRVVEVLDRAVSECEYLAADHFTAADLYVGASLGWGLQFGILPQRDALVAYVSRLQAREAAVRANELDDALIAKAA